MMYLVGLSLYIFTLKNKNFHNHGNISKNRSYKRFQRKLKQFIIILSVVIFKVMSHFNDFIYIPKFL